MLRNCTRFFSPQSHTTAFWSLRRLQQRTGKLWLQLKDDIVTSQEIMVLDLLETFVEPTDVSLLNSRGSCKFSINTVWATLGISRNTTFLFVVVCSWSLYYWSLVFCFVLGFFCFVFGFIFVFCRCIWSPDYLFSFKLPT